MADQAKAGHFAILNGFPSDVLAVQARGPEIDADHTLGLLEDRFPPAG